MKARVGALGLVLLLAACEGDDKDEISQAAEPAASELRTLSGEEIRRVLTGNTLVGYDGAGPYWMYYPSGGTIWGQASNGDVDVGRWSVEGNLYCRAWRRWRGQAERCWNFATDGFNRLIWMEPSGNPSGESTLQAGNTIGQVTGAQLVSLYLESDAVPAPAPVDESQPVDAFGVRLASRGGSGEPGGIDAGSGGDAGAGGSSSGGASGGSASGGSTSGGSTSGGSTSGSSTSGSSTSSGSTSGSSTSGSSTSGGSTSGSSTSGGSSSDGSTSGGSSSDGPTSGGSSSGGSSSDGSTSSGTS
jgi:hypothetical protein